MRSIDLFAGIGGIRLGFEQAFGTELETVFVSEWDSFANMTYKKNFTSPIAIVGDITQVAIDDIPEFDCCLAGFPCQAFSLAGKKEGFNDDWHGRCRGTLFREVIRICEQHKPKVIFCENVKGLVVHDGGTTLRIITESFESIGYKVFQKVLNSRNFGVPQNRERIYIVCFRKDIAPDCFSFPSARLRGPLIDLLQPEEPVRQPTIRDILENAPIPSKYYLSDIYLETLELHKKRNKSKGNGFGYLIRNVDGLAGSLVCGGMGREVNLICDPRPHSNIPTTKIKGKINTKHIRKMTPREWARLQGFPDSFVLPVSDTQLYKQLGNTVTVPVIRAIAERIRNYLNKKE